MPAPYVSEVKFQGAASLDFIEVAVDAGLDVSNIQIVVYNPDGTVRSTNSLGSLVTTEAGRDVYVIDTASSGTFNGLHRNGAVALVNNGTVTSFLSFNTTVTATAGPANGTSSTALGGTSGGQSLETSDNGATYQVQSSPTPGNVPCFLTGTLIQTVQGPRPVEALRPGDRVLTLDAGPQPLFWVGTRHLKARERCDLRKLPLCIPAGALAPGLPSRDLYLSPNHRIMLEHPLAALHFHSHAILAPAKALSGYRGVRIVSPAARLSYHHLLLAEHHVLLANDAPAESLHLGRMGVEGFDAEAQSHIIRAVGNPAEYGPTARTALTCQEARLLMHVAGPDALVSPPSRASIAA